MDELQRYKHARRVTLVGAATNLVLAIIKVIFGLLGRSHALFADGIHSFSDLLSDALVLLASRFGSRKADWDHPYGHERIETAATLLLALLLSLAGIGIILDSGDHLLHQSYEHPKVYVLYIAVLSILANEGLYHYTLRAGNKLRSKLLTANAWHHRSDAASSLVVLVGVAGTLIGFHYLDAVAAIIVGFMIIHMGWQLGWSSVRELVDTGVNKATLINISNAIIAIPGVLEIHQLRTRSMADNILVDVHILVDPNLSVSEGHYIATRVHGSLLKQFNNITDVTVHVDPENDETAAPNRDLPARNEILPTLMAHWNSHHCAGVDNIERVLLHYLSGKINVEILMPWSVAEQAPDWTKLQQQYREAISDINFIETVVLYFH